MTDLYDVSVGSRVGVSGRFIKITYIDNNPVSITVVDQVTN